MIDQSVNSVLKNLKLNATFIMLSQNYCVGKLLKLKRVMRVGCRGTRQAGSGEGSTSQAVKRKIDSRKLRRRRSVAGGDGR